MLYVSFGGLRYFLKSHSFEVNLGSNDYQEIHQLRGVGARFNRLAFLQRYNGRTCWRFSYWNLLQKFKNTRCISIG